MIFAQISNGVIVNTIVLQDSSILSLFQNDPTTDIPYDYVLQVDSQYPQPGVGWLFDGIVFSPPSVDDSDEGDE